MLVFTFSSAEERDTFEYIFQKYKRLMLHKAYGILQDYTLAEDAASEAFIRIYKNLDKIEDPASPKCVAFIVTIVKNVALTMRRREILHSVEEYDMELADDFNVEEHILSSLSANQIYQAVDTLSEELKGVFLLRYANDLSTREISRILGISENNVNVRLHRAKNKLATLLRKEG